MSRRLPATLVEAFVTEPGPAERIVVHFQELGGPDTDVTAGELSRTALRVARGLRRAGVQRGDRVLLLLPTGPDFLFSFHGCLAAGAIPTPVFPPAAPSQLRRFQDTLEVVHRIAEPRLTLTSARLQELLRDRAKLPSLVTATPSDLLDAAGDEEELVEPDPGDLALLQFSSGSTGNPRGACLSHRNILSNIGDWRRSILLGESDTFVSWLPLYHDMGLIGGLLGPQVLGARSICFPPTDFIRSPGTWLRALGEHGGTISVAPQFAYTLCATKLQPEELEGVHLDSVRLLLNGAEPIDPAAVRLFQERFRPLGLAPGAVVPCYGLAENALAVSFPPLDGTRVRAISRERLLDGSAEPPLTPDDGTEVVCVGTAIEHTEVRICDANGSPVGEGSVAEICFRGDSACAQLMTEDGPIPSPSADGWTRTGDLGFIADGELYVVGRVKDVIIIAGHNYHASDFESAALDAIAELRPGRVVAFPVTLPQRGTEGFVVAAETGRLSAERFHELAGELRRGLLRRFSVGPEEVVLLAKGALPRTTSGKLQRSRVREEYEQSGLRAALFARRFGPTAPGPAEPRGSTR